MGLKVRGFVGAALGGLVAALVATSAVVVPAGSASAVGWEMAPDEGDMAYYADITWARLHHTDRKVVVEIAHRDLRRSGSAEASVFFDTDYARWGAEYVLRAGLFEGADYTLSRARGFKPTRQMVNCSYKMLLDFEANRSKFRVMRACFDDPERLRVGVRVGGRNRSGDWVADWAGYTRWTPWIPAGPRMGRVVAP